MDIPIIFVTCHNFITVCSWRRFGINIHELRLLFHWSLFLGVELTTFQALRPPQWYLTHPNGYSNIVHSMAINNSLWMDIPIIFVTCHNFITVCSWRRFGINIHELRLLFHWSLFLGVELTTFQALRPPQWYLTHPNGYSNIVHSTYGN